MPLGIAEVLPLGAALLPQSEIPIMSSTMRTMTMSPPLCSFFIEDPYKLRES
jgi:hypothetical protein